ncbi:MAG: hypothetical protein QQN63_03740 [Nitrosopumilus sp.]
MKQRKNKCMTIKIDNKEVLREDSHSFVLLQHLSNEQIVHSTNISSNKEGNKYIVKMLRCLADKIEETGQGKIINNSLRA